MSTIPLTESDGDSPLHIIVGDEVRLSLAQTGGTGFIWSTAPLPECLTLSCDVVDHSAANPGAAGTRVITLTAVQAGRGTIAVTLGRPWPGGETDRQLSFDVTVS